MTEYEEAQLKLAAEQIETLKRLEGAMVEQGKTLETVLNELHSLASKPNVVQLTRRMQRAEGEISELQGEVARHAAQIQNFAAGGSNGG